MPIIIEEIDINQETQLTVKNPKYKTICLNMIVKNESKVITRLFDSLLNVIDTYCICDTGSTDSTRELIKKYFDSKNIPGKIIEKPFQDFGTNRTYSLMEAKGMADYILLMDADMVLKVGSRFDKSKLDKDVYNIKQGTNSFQYFNTRLVSDSVKIVCKGPTHEYYDVESPHTSSHEDTDFLFIEDIGDGGSKSNKYRRDIELLTKGLETEPNNGRYHFYLGNSYFDVNETENAIKSYRNVIRVGSWIEEIFYSYLKLGHCYKRLNDEPNMIHSWIMAYNSLPERAESLYEIIHYYRNTGKNQLCKLFYETAKNIKFPTHCSLFIHKDVYDYKLLEEFSIFSYWINERDICREYFDLFNKAPSHRIYSLLNNYKFYQKIITPSKSIKLSEQFVRTFHGEEYTFISSTPSIVKHNNEYIVNLRCVNYRINKDGTYPWYKHITTVNKKYIYNPDFEISSVSEIIDKDKRDRRYIGVEDVKLHVHNDKLVYTGTGLLESGYVGIVMGNYDVFDKIELKYADSMECEKNWVFIPGNNLRMIYKWYPLTYGTVYMDTLEIEKKTEMPYLFTQVRGSTNGCLYNNEIWFIVHMVHQNNNEPRHYYHMFVVFDTDMNLKRYSMPFKFTPGEIEYTTGFVIEEKHIIVTHSVWDRESYLRVYTHEEINNLFKN
jgi:tetratricopeptide (TPR) repeat protein